MRVGDLDTPAVVVDLDRVEANLKRAQDYADAHGMKLRPHVKTHKLPLFARWQMERGAVGITCQKLGEAEVMVEAGISDIFLPYNILGPGKLDRLAALNDRIMLSVTADSSVVLAGYADRFRDAGRPLTTLIECDTGAERCGVTAPADVLPLAREIVAAPGLRFGGLMTYPPRGKVRDVTPGSRMRRHCWSGTGSLCRWCPTGARRTSTRPPRSGRQRNTVPGPTSIPTGCRCRSGWGRSTTAR